MGGFALRIFDRKGREVYKWATKEDLLVAAVGKRFQLRIQPGFEIVCWRPRFGALRNSLAAPAPNRRALLWTLIDALPNLAA